MPLRRWNRLLCYQLSAVTAWFRIRAAASPMPVPPYRVQLTLNPSPTGGGSSLFKSRQSLPQRTVMLRTSHIETVGLAVILGVSVTFNAMLITKITRISATVRAEQAMQQRTRQTPLMVGDTVPALQGVLLNGVASAVSFGDRQAGVATIVYVLDAGCRFCTMNMASMHALERQTRGRYKFIGVALSDEGLDSYVEKNEIRFPVFRSVTDEVRTSYRLSATPSTLLVSPDGVVEGVWEGAYREDVKAELEERLHVVLPTL